MMVITIFILVTALYVAFVNRFLKAEELKINLAETSANLEYARELYNEQSLKTSALVVAIAPLVEKTAWLGPQPYGVVLKDLQALEEKRNEQILVVRETVMALPVVQEQSRETLRPLRLGT